MTPFQLRRCRDILRHGGIISYPTEAVFGLGCDPLNATAVHQLLALKKRTVDKGLILIASQLEQVLPFIKLPSAKHMQPVLKSWPGPYTWLLPAADNTPYWLTGNSDKIAIRITDHAITRSICDTTDMAIVSTSANPSGLPAVQSSLRVRAYFKKQLDFIVSGHIVGNNKPSIIRDAISGKLIRA